MPDQRLIMVSGTAGGRGEALGKAYGHSIAAHVDALLRCYHDRGSDEPRAYLDEFLARTSFHDAIGKHMPHLLDEVDAMAAVSGCDDDLVYALQLMDEEWAYRSNQYGAPPQEKCSSFAVRDDAGDQTWIGQNMDLGSYTDGFQRLVHHVPKHGPEMLVFTTVGMLGLLGINDAGVGICCNSLPQLPSAPEGIPVAFMVRRLLEAESARVAADLCRNLPHATNQHYLIADPERIISLECSAAGVNEYQPTDPTRVLHTNHPLVGDPPDLEAERNSLARLESLRSRLSTGRPTIETLQAALSAFDDPEHPVCRLKQDDSGTINFTTGSMINRLRRNPDDIESYVSFGPPSECGFERYAFVASEAAAPKVS